MKIAIKWFFVRLWARLTKRTFKMTLSSEYTPEPSTEFVAANGHTMRYLGNKRYQSLGFKNSPWTI